MQVSNWGSVEPTTLEELQALAKSDLEKLDPGVLLKWAMIQARLAGRSALAGQMLQYAEQTARDFRYRRLMPIDEQTLAYIAHEGVRPDDLARARADYEEAVACAAGADKVIALLERALRQRSDQRKSQQQNPKERPKAA